MKRLALSAVGLSLLLAGCSAQTEPPMYVTDTKARMIAKVSCDPGETGTMWWRYAKENASTWTTTNPIPWTCPEPNKITGLPLGRDISGLQPSTRYRYQFCGKKGEVSFCYNANGVAQVPEGDQPEPLDSITTNPTPPLQTGVQRDGSLGATTPGGGVTLSKKAPGIIDHGIGPASNTPDYWLVNAARYWGVSGTCPAATVGIIWSMPWDSVFWAAAYLNACQGWGPRTIWINPRWYNPDPDEQWRWCGIVIHEYGHLIGLTHPQMSPEVLNAGNYHLPGCG